MRTLAHELDQLGLAERHIAEAEKRVDRLDAEIRRARLEGRDIAGGEQVLDTLRRGLLVFRRHREVIAQMVDDLRSEGPRDC